MKPSVVTALAFLAFGLALFNTMERKHASMLAAAQLVWQAPTEPDEYPKDVFCTPKGKNVFGVQTTDDPCHCVNMVGATPDGECTMPLNNDPECKQWCHEKHCECPKKCSEPK